MDDTDNLNLDETTPEASSTPTHLANAFECPHCHAFAQMNWMHTGHLAEYNTTAAKCARCTAWSIWVNERMVYPDTSLAPPADEGLSDEVKAIYDEAASISVKSPKGAAALLRLAIEMTCIELGAKGKKLHDRIGWLVKERNLSAVVQQSLDAVRVIGNNAVHPGEIALDDDPETVTTLFHLTNIIVRTMITEPKAAEAIFNSLPEGAKDAVERRDNGN